MAALIGAHVSLSFTEVPILPPGVPRESQLKTPSSPPAFGSSLMASSLFTKIDEIFVFSN